MHLAEAGTGRLLGGVGVIDRARDLEPGSPPITHGQTLMAKTDRPLLRRGRNSLAHLRTLCPARTDLMAALWDYSRSRRPGTIRELKLFPSPSLRFRAEAAESPPDTNTASPNSRRAIFWQEK